MFLKYFLPVLALSGLSFGLWTVNKGAEPVPVAPPAAAPAEAPFAETIAGAGIVEARTQNIAVGTPVAGVVVEVAAQVGQRVKRGDVLFRIDDRDRRAELAVREAALATARAELARLERAPRAEDLPPLEARVASAETDLADLERQLEIAESLPDKRAMATQEWDRRRFAVQASTARLSAARADLARVRAGAWEPDLAVARANVASAEARVDAQRVELERTVVRASVDGTVLQSNVRSGEFAQASAVTGQGAQPLMLLGDVDVLHVRVDIDENDAWRFRPGARGVAHVRGNRELKTDIEFVRVDPYVLPKRSLTGESTERVDTRVLQVLYRFDAKSLPVYAGQQMDVFLEGANGGAR